MRLEDLPPKIRAQVEAQHGVKARAKPSRAGVGHSVLCPGRCRCGERFASYAAFERHASPGHRRWIIDL